MPIILWHLINPFATEIGLFWENKVNTMAADALASSIAKSLASRVSNMQNKIR